MVVMAAVNVVVIEAMIANLLGASRRMLRHSVMTTARSRVHSPIIETVTSKTAHRVPVVVLMAPTRDRT
jgi:hypothetical protein